MVFVDLFAGLGGFHLALGDLGHECVFACELHEGLRDLYEKNFGLRPAGDIREVPISSIPHHDILCAGFPCQPFSKAGEQNGFDCPKWGDLFEFVLQLLEVRRPDYFILENVPNLTKHNGGQTWKAILEKLRAPEWGYDVDSTGRLSPHQFGIPQIRDRIFIVGSRKGLVHFKWPKPTGKTPSLGKILSRKTVTGSDLPPHYIACMDVWQNFLDQYPKDKKLPSFPIWSMEFGATYPYQHTTPYAMLRRPKQRRELLNTLGSHGRSLAELGPKATDDEILNALPSHARTKEERFPNWKIAFIRQNRELYCMLQPWIAGWIPKILPFASSLQKLEWNYKGGERTIWRHLIQIRASGVRVKRYTTAPSLVAMTTTQIPIVGKTRETKRYMTMRECARLQSMHGLAHLPPTTNQAFKALGNAVNVEVVRLIAKALLHPPSNFGGDGSIDETAVSIVNNVKRPSQLGPFLESASETH